MLLPVPLGPDEGDHLAGPDLGRHVAQDLLPVPVAEPDIVEGQDPRPQGQPHRVASLRDRRRRIENAEHAPGGGLEHPHLGDELRQPLQRVPQLSDVVHEDDQRADGHAARDGSEELVAID